MTPPPIVVRLQGRAGDWFAGLSPREQTLIAGFAALAVLTVFVTAVWAPLQASRAEARADIHTYETVSARLRSAGPALAARPARLSGSAASIVTDTAAEAGLTIQKLEPDGVATRVTFEDADFDRLMRWLDHVETVGGLKLTELKLDRRPAPGVVNAQIALAGR